MFFVLPSLSLPSFYPFYPLRFFPPTLLSSLSPTHSPSSFALAFVVVIFIIILSRHTVNMPKEGSQIHWMYRQLFVTPPPTTKGQVNLSGQVGIITGANAGLGLEASKQLLDLGLSHLILAVRDDKRGSVAKDDLLNAFPSARVEVWPLNLSSYDSVQAFARKCETLSRLDFCILNAGVFKTSLVINQETNHDEVVQVNYLSTALLTILMLPVLKAKRQSTTPGKVVIVSSETADWCKFKEQRSDPILPAFNVPKNFAMEERYYTSKLLEQLFLVELVKHVKNSDVVVNAVNPGFCYGSTLHTELTGVMGGVLSTFKRGVGRPTSVGARTLVNAAVVQGASSHGKYLGDCIIKPYVESIGRLVSLFLFLTLIASFL